MRSKPIVVAAAVLLVISALAGQREQAQANTLVATALPTLSLAVADPPLAVPFAKAVEQADYVGIIEVTESPVGKKFLASAPPSVTAKPIAVLKGDAKGNVRFVWQTYCMVCQKRDPETIDVEPPAVGEQYLVVLAKDKSGALNRLGYQWHFHKMSAVPHVQRTHSRDTSWRWIVEASPLVVGPGEVVKCRFTGTRLAEAYTGSWGNTIADDLHVVDFTRKRVLSAVKPGKRNDLASTTVEKGETVVNEIDLTDAFGITQPGEYWVLPKNGLGDDGPLRFEVSDKIRKR